MNINMSSGGRVVINGQEYRGNNIQVVNGQVTIDGKAQEGQLPQVVNVVVHGDVDILENQSGNVEAQNVGSVTTGSGDVSCGEVSGGIRTGSGDVTCGNVKGSIRTGSGDVMHR